MEEGFQAAGVPLITALVFGALFMYKTIIGDNEKLSRLVPVFAILLGCIFGVIGYFFVDGLIPAHDILTAILVGGASGLAATGTHQIFKQLTKASSSKDEPDSVSGSESASENDSASVNDSVSVSSAEGGNGNDAGSKENG